MGGVYRRRIAMFPPEVSLASKMLDLIEAGVSPSLSPLADPPTDHKASSHLPGLGPPPVHPFSRALNGFTLNFLTCQEVVG